MTVETIFRNNFLSRNITLCWMFDYVRCNSNQNDVGGYISTDIRTLKNQFHQETSMDLQSASQRIEACVCEGLDTILQRFPEEREPYVVVAVPRSKATFTEDQLYLIRAISKGASQYHVENGAYFIKRHSDTKTTHLMNTRIGDMNTTGDAPYPGITGRTCSLQGNIQNRNVILIDDIYTPYVNIDEDCAQFLFDNGARNVIMFTLCKTQQQD